MDIHELFRLMVFLRPVTDIFEFICKAISIQCGDDTCNDIVCFLA